MAKPKKREGTKPSKIDEELEESFPASDPPAFMGGHDIVGAPPRRKKKARKVKAKAKPAMLKIKRASQKKRTKKKRR
jgi:hypothetical protein